MSTERTDRATAHAFDLPPDPTCARDAAVLCLHGLTGTPFEVLPLGEALAARGLRAKGPWMAGHEGGPEALARTTHADWVALATAELDRLRSEHAQVFVAGVSMGGLVSLRLAQTRRVEGLVVVGTPLELGWPIRLFLPIARLFASSRAKDGSDIREPQARARHPSLAAMPLASVAELIRLQGLVAPALARVEAPILVAHGRLDRTARPRDAARLHAEVGSREKELFYLERSGHVATVDYDGPGLARAAADFLARRC